MRSTSSSSTARTRADANALKLYNPHMTDGGYATGSTLRLAPLTEASTASFPDAPTPRWSGCHFSIACGLPTG